MQNKNKELDRLNGVYMKLLNNAGVKYIEGRGTLVDAHTVEVEGKQYTVGCSVSHTKCVEQVKQCKRPAVLSSFGRRLMLCCCAPCYFRSVITILCCVLYINLAVASMFEPRFETVNSGNNKWL